MNKFLRTVTPSKDSSLTTDVIMFIVPLFWILPLAVYNLTPHSASVYKYSGPGFSDGSLGVVGDVFGLAFMLLLSLVFILAATRIIFRIISANRKKRTIKH